MKKQQFIIVISLLFLSVVSLSILWEFYLEDTLGSAFLPHYHPEVLAERLEYVISVSLFVGISLIFPTLFGLRLINKHNTLLGDLHRTANEDYLTGLYNRRKISEELHTEIARSKRYNREFSVILIDIDNFKETNDTHGHNCGDTLLKEITEIIDYTVRDTDITGRWGGEEFLVICPETDLTGTIALAEKIRSVIESSEFTNVGKKTASFGVTTYIDDKDTQSIIKRADIALYKAKDGGKNRVEEYVQ